MARLIEVRFLSYRQPYRYNAGTLPVSRGTLVILERDGHVVPATVEREPVEVPDAEVPAGTPRVLRVATEEDRSRLRANVQLEAEAYRYCRERIRARGLPMKLVAARIHFDGSKAVFYFTADGRVDFRELVKDLAHRLRMRIEMLQIGVRDESKMLGGHGLCGRPLCCSTWIDEFAPVSIRMAKDQNLSLNPAKVSGVCGRLMCCLSYEHEIYREAGRGLPKLGKRVQTPEGRGKVSRMDVLKRQVFVWLDEGREIQCRPEEITIPPPPVSEGRRDRDGHRPPDQTTPAAAPEGAAGGDEDLPAGNGNNGADEEN